MGCHALLQGIFLTQGWSLSLLCLLHWQVLYHEHHLEGSRAKPKVCLGSHGWVLRGHESSKKYMYALCALHMCVCVAGICNVFVILKSLRATAIHSLEGVKTYLHRRASTGLTVSLFFFFFFFYRESYLTWSLSPSCGVGISSTKRFEKLRFLSFRKEFGP